MTLQHALIWPSKCCGMINLEKCEPILQELLSASSLFIDTL